MQIDFAAFLQCSLSASLHFSIFALVSPLQAQRNPCVYFLRWWWIFPAALSDSLFNYVREQGAMSRKKTL